MRIVQGMPIVEESPPHNPLTPPGTINILQRNHLHLPPLLQRGDALDGGPGAGEGGDGGDGVIEGGAA